MKMRNLFLAFALTILASFSISTTTFATTADIPIVEDGVNGVNGVINDLVTDNGTTMIVVNAPGVITLSLVNMSGQKVWNIKVNAGVVTIPTDEFAAGTYTLIASAGRHIDMRTITLQGNTQQAVEASESAQF